MPYSELAEYRRTASFSRLNGHSIAHWQAGQGETILLIHGFPSAAWDWHHLWQPLSQTYQVITLDMLGFGLSEKPFPHRYSLLEQADLIAALLKQQGITKCHILAHDYGNSVAQELLSRYHADKLGTSISSMVFLNGGLFSESHRPLLTQKLLKSPIGRILSSFMNKGSLHKSFTRIFGPNTPPQMEEIDVLWQLLRENNGVRVMHDLLAYIGERKVHRNSWLNAMQNTEIPLHFINGVYDPISGQHMLDRYCELVPNPQVSALQVGHYPQLEAPENVLEIYQNFIQQR